MAEGAKRANSVDPKKIADALHGGQPVKTVIGDIGFDKKGDITRPDYTVYTWKKGADGKIDLVREGAGVKPIFGVCLGLQAMGQAFGGDVVRAALPMHGKVSAIKHRSRGLFRGINGPLQATRYHSLVVDRATCPAVFDIEAETDDGLIMALSHRELPIHGVQFHPESIASEHGATILRNFLDLAQRWRSEHEAAALSPSA